MDESSSAPQPAAADALPERSDRLLERALGRDLQGATLRSGLYLLVIGAVLATIAWLVG
jgi:hypothetical protein